MTLSASSRFLRSWLLLAGLLFAAPALAHSERPERLVQQTFDDALSALHENREAVGEDPRVAYRLIEEILAPHVDFELMSRLILARHWQNAEAPQRERFVEVFRESLLRTYSRLLSDNVDVAAGIARTDRQLMRMLPSEGPDSRGRVTVRTQLRLADQNVSVDYRMIQRGGDWQVFDVLIENISFVMNYRSEYDADLQRGDLNGLIRRLEERNRRAWEGA